MMSIAIVRPSVNRLNCEPKPGVPNAKIAPKIAISAMSPIRWWARRPGAEISVQVIAARARLASEAAWGLFDRGRRVHIKACCRSIGRFRPFSAYGRKGPKDRVSDKILFDPHPGPLSGRWAVMLRTCSNSRAGEIGLLEIGKDLLGDRLHRGDVIVDGVLVGIDGAESMKRLVSAIVLNGASAFTLQPWRSLSSA